MKKLFIKVWILVGLQFFLPGIGWVNGIPQEPVRALSSEVVARDTDRWPLERVFWQELSCQDREAGEWNDSVHYCRPGQSSFTLEPGEALVISLENPKPIRVTSPGRRLEPEDLSLETGNGSGLFLVQPLRKNVSGNGLVSLDKAPVIGSVYRLRRPPSARNELTFELETLEREYETARFHSLKERTIGRRRVLVQGENSDNRELAVTEALQTSSLQVKGPADLLLEHQPLYFDEDLQRRIEYRLEVELIDSSGRSPSRKQVFEFMNLPEQGELITLEGIPFTLGRRQHSLLTIPEGDITLNLTPTRTVGARVLGKTGTSFLLPHLNQPAAWEEFRQELHRQLESPSPAWDAEPLFSSDLDPRGDMATPARALQTVRRLVDDNHYQPGGLAAHTYLKNILELHPDLGDSLIDNPLTFAPGTGYRSLLPRDKDHRIPPQTVWFVTPRLKNRRDRNLVLGEQHLADTFPLLGRGVFTCLSNIKNGTTEQVEPASLRYELPPRAADSLLRLAFPYSAEERTFSLALDDGSHHEIRLAPGPTFSNKEFWLSLPEAGLWMLANRFKGNSVSTLSGGFGLYEDPGDMASVAFLEIMLPAKVQTLELRASDSSEKPLFPAVQYQDGFFHAMTEADFLTALEAIGGRAELIKAFRCWLAKDESVSSTGGITGRDPLPALAIRDLENDYFPLITHMKSLAYTFNQGIVPAENVITASRFALNSEQTVAAAAGEEMKGNWLAALELRANQLNQSSGHERVAAMEAYNQALVQLGENYLAEVQLKGLYLYPAGSDGLQLANMAFKLLRQRYRNEDREDKLLELLATEFIRTARQDLLPELAGLMERLDQPRSALLLCLLLPEEHEIPDQLLYAAWRLNWLTLYRILLENLDDGERYNYFQALLKIRQGNTDEAESLLTVAGQRGRDLLGARNDARAIADLLRHRDRQSCRGKWQEWQNGYPGPYVWKDVLQVEDYAGTAMLRSRLRFLYGQAYRSSPEQGVTVRLQGPTQARFTVRPLHPVNSVAPLSTWVEIQDGAKYSLMPISNNFPSPTVELANDSRFAAGQQQTFVYQVEKGEHLVNVRGLGGPILVQVEQLQPQLSCEILPFLSPAVSFAPAGPATENVSLLPSVCTGETCLNIVNDGRVKNSSQGAIRGKIQENLKVEFPTSPTASRQFRELTPTDLRQAAENCIDNGLVNGEECSGFLARYGEVAGPEGRSWAITQMARLYREQGMPASMGSAARHPALQSSWQRVEPVQAEDGIYLRSTTGWQPEAPMLRIRRTMLPPIASEEQVVYDNGKLVFDSNVDVEQYFQLRCRLLEIPYLPSSPLILVITKRDKTGEKEIDRITLGGDKATITRNLRLPPGEQQLTFSLADRYANQFLTIALYREGTEGDGSGQVIPVLPPEPEREYYISTPENPVRLSMEGPAFLRIDRLQENGIVTGSYQYIDRGWQKITITPESTLPFDMVRIFYLAPSDELPEYVNQIRPPARLDKDFPGREIPYFASAGTLSIPYQPHARKIHVGPLSISDQPHARRIQVGTLSVSDQLYARRIQIGTLEVRAKYVSRDTLFEEEPEDQSDDRFFATEISYRYFAPTLPGYFRTELLWRQREHGDQVAGLEEEFIWLPQNLPVTFSLLGSLFYQFSEDAGQGELSPDDEYSGLLRASVSKRIDLSSRSWHVPSFSIFGRYLSLDDDKGYAPLSFDRDVYSDYKADHRDGIRISETYSFCPWLDSIWFAGLSANSNQWPDYTSADNVRMRIGWRQLVGDAEASLVYRGSYSFADDDREDSYYRDRLQFDFSWDLLKNRYHGIRLGGQLSHDFSTNDYSWFLSLSYHWNEGYDFEHYGPGEIDFRNLKRDRYQPDDQ